MFSRVISWITLHEKHVVYGGGLIVVGGLCFVFGVLQGRGLSIDPITVMYPQTEPLMLPCTTEEEGEEATTKKNCKYVGSIKGKKYYPPSCTYAKKIAKENLRCFISDNDAIQKGYQKSTSCK
ncbi:MAG: hypothetical protein CR972_02100 [Candidatus Moraniibacteriota bacterium]|nr:MAG: hypothetical protein CR972_02100 [Candidatus Moranbacteria bacterium]